MNKTLFEFILIELDQSSIPVAMLCQSSWIHCSGARSQGLYLIYYIKYMMLILDSS